MFIQYCYKLFDHVTEQMSLWLYFTVTDLLMWIIMYILGLAPVSSVSSGILPEISVCHKTNNVLNLDGSSRAVIFRHINLN